MYSETADDPGYSKNQADSQQMYVDGILEDFCQLPERAVGSRIGPPVGSEAIYQKPWQNQQQKCANIYCGRWHLFIAVELFVVPGVFGFGQILAATTALGIQSQEGIHGLLPVRVESWQIIACFSEPFSLNQVLPFQFICCRLFLDLLSWHANSINLVAGTLIVDRVFI